MFERGAIRNRQYAQQLRDFRGLRYGSITPTDIDGFMDFGDRLFVLIEGKHAGAQMQRGQMLALERLADACHCPPRRISVALIVDHHEGAGDDIDFGSCTVRTMRWNGAWVAPLQKGIALRLAIDRLKSMADRMCRPTLRVLAGGGS